MKYPVIREPPLEDGATKLTTAELSPAIAVTWRGAFGWVVLVAADTGETADSMDSASSAGTVIMSP
jgi:hypothetical protein